MITIKQAIKIAIESVDRFPIVRIIDIGDRWAFDYDTGTPPIPGFPIVTVDKETGRSDELTIPPLENLDLLDNGSVVYESTDLDS